MDWHYRIFSKYYRGNKYTFYKENFQKKLAAKLTSNYLMIVGLYGQKEYSILDKAISLLDKSVFAFHYSRDPTLALDHIYLIFVSDGSTRNPNAKNTVYSTEYPVKCEKFRFVDFPCTLCLKCFHEPVQLASIVLDYISGT